MIQQVQPGHKQPFPADVYQLAEMHQIGTPVREYKDATVKTLLVGILASVLSGAGIIFGLCIVFDVLPGFHIARVPGLLLLYSVLGLRYGISRTGMAWRHRGRLIYLGADGVMCVQEGNGEAIRWDQITAVQKIFLGGFKTPYYLTRYILWRPDGMQLELSPVVPEFKELERVVEQEVNQRLLPGTIAAYEAGGSVNFGPISVTAQGVSLQDRKKFLPWSAIQSIKVDNGFITFKKKDTFAGSEKVRTSGMPNLCVFTGLLNFPKEKKKMDSYPNRSYGQQQPLRHQHPASLYGQPPPYGQPQPQWGQQLPPQYQQPPYGVSPTPNFGPPQQPKKGSRRWLWITLSIVGGIIALSCAGCAITAALGVGLFDKLAGPTFVAGDYYRAIDSQNYAQAYTYLDSNATLTVGGQSVAVAQADAFTTEATMLDNRLGPVSSDDESIDPHDFSRIDVTVTRNGPSYLVHLQFTQVGSDWKITSADGI